MDSTLRKSLLAIRSLVAPRFKILAYHGVPRDSPLEYEVGIEQFRAQIYTLGELGYKVLGLHEAVIRVANRVLPPRVIVLTFDDAHESVADNAIPILHDLRLTATIFVPTGLVGGEDLTLGGGAKRNVMSWSALGALVNSGFAVGSHSVSHRNMLELNVEDQTREAWDSYRALTEHFGLKPYYFAYPYGLLNDNVYRSVLGVPYVGALCFGSVLSNWEKTNHYLLKRERILASTSITAFRRIIDPGYDIVRSLTAILRWSIRASR